MTTKNNFHLNKVFILQILFFLFTQILFSADWIVGAEAFSVTQNQKFMVGSISQAIETGLPEKLLDKLSSNLYRTIGDDELYTRELSKLRQDRQSLFLQLSSEVKKRDALVFENYSQSELKEKILEQEKKIKEIQKKIDESLEMQKEKEQALTELLENAQIELKNNQTSEKSKSEIEKYSSFFKSLFLAQEEAPVVEKIALYKNDKKQLFKPSENAKGAGYLSNDFIKEAETAKINTLVTGNVISYGDYIFVTAELYLYPVGRLLTVVSEVGSIDELDLIAESITRQIVPSLTNAMPIKVKVSVEPPQAKNKLKFYIDGVLQGDISQELVMDSGVHYLEFSAESFRTAATSYYFAGNKNYNIDVQMEAFYQGTILLSTLKNPKETEKTEEFLSVENELDENKSTEEHKDDTVKNKTIENGKVLEEKQNTQSDVLAETLTEKLDELTPSDKNTELDTESEKVQKLQWATNIAGKITAFTKQSIKEVQIWGKELIPGLYDFPKSYEGTGDFYAFAESLKKDEDGKSKIQINGETILGEFISESGDVAFFYVPNNFAFDNANLVVDIKPFNRSDYIEKHRRRMYSAYSLLMVSLIPNYIYPKDKALVDDNGKWLKPVFVGLSWFCGIWTGYELVRYFLAVDSVLPEEAKIVTKETENGKNKKSKEKIIKSKGKKSD
ncbi:MAG: hypothetical protein MJ188_09705 [Treponema sp.]|nr:hypothetical protein [Treponema sp.]